MTKPLRSSELSPVFRRLARLPRWLTYVAAVGAVALMALDPGQVLSALRERVFDVYQRIDPRPYVDPATKGLPTVRFVDIDDASLAVHGQWPWPRTLLAELLGALAKGGARVVIFDIVFAETDRTSPFEVTRGWPKGPPYDSLRLVLSSLPTNDSVFAAAMTNQPTVTGFILGGDGRGEQPTLKTNPAVVGDAEPNRFVPAYANSAVSLKELEDAAAGNGSLNVVPDSDGIIRRVPLLVSLNGNLYPSALVEALRVAATPQNIVVKTSGAAGQQSFGEATGIVAVKAGKFIVPTTSTGALYLHYTPAEPSRRISAKDVLAGTVDPARLKNAIVWVGTSAAGLRDLRATPLDPAAAGVEIQVQATESALLGVALSRPDFARGAEFVYAVVFGLLVAFFSLRSSAYWIGLLAIGVVAVAFGFSWWAFEAHRWLVDPAGPSLVAFAAFLTGTLVRFAETEGERAYVRRAFAQYLQDDIIERLASDPDRLKLGGETRTMTILFCDIRGFTTISEHYKADPAGLTLLINRVLTPLTRAVIDRDGTVDKYIGDCVMAFWNAPIDDPNHIEHACLCALDILAALDTVNAELQEKTPGAPIIRVGIGINTGQVVVGNMGSDLRFDYSVLGDAVNLAARIQGYSGNYGVDIVLGEDTARTAVGFARIKVDRIAVKGKTEAANIYALLGGPHIATAPALAALQMTHDDLFTAIAVQDWDRAEAIARRLSDASPLGQRLYRLHLDRIAQLRANPPGLGWDGGWHADTK
ncbi:MAG: adenylate/guanylate cyclase domain-containing protein [Alphaproteobacteria bacterium]|nr:adenylate/guanylate cyclase domain-containing protein [Alphaproteobacteria bacterium]